jgi:hypothetical protein
VRNDVWRGRGTTRGGERDEWQVVGRGMIGEKIAINYPADE